MEDAAVAVGVGDGTAVCGVVARRMAVADAVGVDVVTNGAAVEAAAAGVEAVALCV